MIIFFLHQIYQGMFLCDLKNKFDYVLALVQDNRLKTYNGKSYYYIIGNRIIR